MYIEPFRERDSSLQTKHLQIVGVQGFLNGRQTR